MFRNELKLSATSSLIVTADNRDASTGEAVLRTEGGILLPGGHLQLAASPPAISPVDETGDHYFAVFRALSKILVPGYFVDFSDADVLKVSTHLLKNQTVYPNHWRDVERWVGTVSESAWNEKSDPAGIDILLRISKKHNERIVDGLKEGAIHSGSVGVRYAWKKSHEEEDRDWYFWDMLGQEVNGEIVRLIVTRIYGYDEYSLVYQGGDPYAKNSTHPLNTVHKFSISTHQNSSKPGEDPRQQEDDVAQISLTIDGPTSQKLGMPDWKNKTIKDAADFERFVSETADRVEQLERQNEELKGLAEIGQESIKAERLSAEKFYRLVTGDDEVEESQLEFLQHGDIAHVRNLLGSYKKLAEKMHPLNDEGSRRSSLSTGKDEPRSEVANINDYRMG